MVMFLTFDSVTVNHKSLWSLIVMMSHRQDYINSRGLI